MKMIEIASDDGGTKIMTLSLPRAAIVVLFDRLREDLSERCTCSAWNYDSEEMIPRLCALAVRQGVP